MSKIRGNKDFHGLTSLKRCVLLAGNESSLYVLKDLVNHAVLFLFLIYMNRNLQYLLDYPEDEDVVEAFGLNFQASSGGWH